MNRLILIICVFLTLSSEAQDIKWVTFDELPNLSQQEAKPIMVFIHTLKWYRLSTGVVCGIKTTNIYSLLTFFNMSG